MVVRVWLALNCFVPPRGAKPGFAQVGCATSSEAGELDKSCVQAMLHDFEADDKDGEEEEVNGLREAHCCLKFAELICLAYLFKYFSFSHFRLLLRDRSLAVL